MTSEALDGQLQSCYTARAWPEIWPCSYRVRTWFLPVPS